MLSCRGWLRLVALGLALVMRWIRCRLDVLKKEEEEERTCGVSF
jgi:hypothetical protein